jgi:hypothetical protein
MTDCMGNELAIPVLGNKHVDDFPMVPTIRHQQQPAVPEPEDKGLSLIPEPLWDIAADNRPTAGVIDKANIERRQPTEKPAHDFRLEDALQ